MGKILLVNTGPTEYERYGMYPLLSAATELEAPISEWAEASAQRLLEYKPIAVYYCPVPAALETADIIGHMFSQEPKTLPGVGDSRQVQWKGLSPEEAAAMDCPLNEKDLDAINIKFPFAVDLDELRQKIAIALDNVAEKHKKDTIAIVSHRALTVVMILHFLHMSNRHFNQIAQENGAVSLFEVRGGVPSALYINDTCHLKGLI